jgi:glycosyltransferase involved in cell wall biosynthesis
MHNKIKITLGLPVYNGENFLQKTLDSILKQTFKEFKIIICDNCSTDKTEEICRHYSQIDDRVEYHRNDSNLGAAGNFNKVFNLSESKYFKWATHDDVLAPEFLQKCFEILESDDETNLCYTKRIIIDENDIELERVSDGLFLNQNETSARYRHFLKRMRYTTRWAIPILGLFRSSELKKTRLLGAYPAADTMILCEVALRGKFYEVDDYLLLSRKHSGMSNKANPSPEKLAVFYDPKNKSKVQLPRWRWFFENRKSIKLAPLKFSTKIKCYLSLSSWAFFRTKSLIVDIIRAVPQYFYIKFSRAK